MDDLLKVFEKHMRTMLQLCEQRLFGRALDATHTMRTLLKEMRIQAHRTDRMTGAIAETFIAMEDNIDNYQAALEGRCVDEARIHVQWTGRMPRA